MYTCFVAESQTYLYYGIWVSGLSSTNRTFNTYHTWLDWWFKLTISVANRGFYLLVIDLKYSVLKSNTERYYMHRNSTRYCQYFQVFCEFEEVWRYYWLLPCYKSELALNFQMLTQSIYIYSESCFRMYLMSHHINLQNVIFIEFMQLLLTLTISIKLNCLLFLLLCAPISYFKALLMLEKSKIRNTIFHVVLHILYNIICNINVRRLDMVMRNWLIAKNQQERKLAVHIT